MSLFLKTHWMAGSQAGRQAGKQAGKQAKHWGRQTKESKDTGKSGVIQAYHSHNHKCE
jgi:hypothetical protein